MKYIVVDVDGVLNSFGPTVDSFEAYGIRHNEEFRLNLDKKHAKWLLELQSDIPDSELVWGTTWQEDANSQIGAQIGLPELAQPPFVLRRASWFNAQWKVTSLAPFLANNEFVWFDDDYDIQYWINQLHLSGKQIQVDSRFGLAKDHVDLARKLLS